MSRRSANGFTLVELIVTLAVAAVLLGMAVPSFVSVLADARLGELVDGPRRALLTARSEAIKSASDVTVCPRASDTACGTNWDNGLLVFVDSAIVPGEGTATRDVDDPVLLIVEPHETDNTLKAIASNNRTASGEYTPNFLRYGPNGRANWQNGTLIACDERGTTHSRALNVTLTGSVREARRDPDTRIPQDIFSRDVSCS